MKILVTGGAGFIGSNLTTELIKRGYDVMVLDNFTTGARENVPASARLFEADIRNLEAIRPAFEGVDYVFHLAALPRIPISIADPVTSHDININGTLNVLLASRDAKVKKVIYSASSSAYGAQSVMPLTETMLPSPMSPYGLQKYVGEHYCRIFSLHYGLPTVCLRYFNVYGPGMASTGSYVTVISVFLQAKRDNKKLSVIGDGTQTRDFTYVGDVVRANILAMKSDQAKNGEAINIGGNRNYSMNELAEKFGGEIEFLPPRLEAHDTLADTAKAQQLLGWKPETDMDEGLAETFKWFEKKFNCRIK